MNGIDWEDVYPDVLFKQVMESLSDEEGYGDVRELWNWLCADEVELDSPVAGILDGIWFAGERAHERLVVGAVGLADEPGVLDGGKIDCALEYAREHPTDPDVIAFGAAFAQIVAKSERRLFGEKGRNRT